MPTPFSSPITAHTDRDDTKIKHMRLIIKQTDITRQEVEHGDNLVIELKPSARVAVDIPGEPDTYLLEEDYPDILFEATDESFTI